MKTITVLLLLTMTMSLASAQSDNCNAASKFEGIQCVQRVGGEKCVLISVNHDTGGMAFDYEWELGDGAIKSGREIDYCYAAYGLYEVKLHLLDPQSGFKFRDELVKTINLEDAGTPEIFTDSEVTFNTQVRFDYSLESIDFRVTETYWSFGDSTFACEQSPMHTFSSKGETEVKLLLVGIKNGRLLEVCSSKSFTISEFILDGKKLNDVFAEKEQTLENRGRFLNDEVHYILYEKDNPNAYQLLDIKQDKYHVVIEPDKLYEMYAWKGNLFTTIMTVSTDGLTQAQSEVRLKESLKQLFSNEPIHIDGLSFVLDVSEPPSEKLDQVARVMQDYNHVNIDIGVYTHTGGRIDKSLELSKIRGEKIKEELIKRGVNESRLDVLTAREEHDLLNTCYGVLNCDLEDETLNRRAEFKIEGVRERGLL